MRVVDVARVVPRAVTVAVMAEERKDVSEMTVAELRERASELEITGRGSMNKDDLVQAVRDAEAQVSELRPEPQEPAAGGQETPDQARAADGEKPASEIPAPSIGPHTVIEKESPDVRLARHEQSDLDAMGLDKRRGVVGKKYGASFAKQATVYGAFLAVVVALAIGGKLAADELDQGPEVDEDKAPWSQAEAEQRPPGDIDFPPSTSE